MKNIVILGAGTGGTLVANLLRRKLDAGQWQVTVIDKATQHLYQPGLLFLPFKLYGYRRAEDLVKPIRKPLPAGVRFLQAEVEAIDTAAREVRAGGETFPYDWLVSAMGCHTAPEEIEGMAESMGEGVHSFYTLDGAAAFQQPLEEFRGGRLVIDIAEMPIKCPVAPIEFAFLADYYFTRKGMRDDVEIAFVTPYSGAFTKPVADRILSKVAEEKGIRVIPNFDLASVDGEARVIRSFEGDSVEYDLLCAIPPNLGPEVTDEAGLGDGTGYVITDARTLKAHRTERVYVLGDNTNVATSKAGSVAHFEAETVVENLLREIDGRQPLSSFDGHANCFVETGHHKAMLLDFNYDVEPITGSFPVPGIGPMALLKETYANHMGKIAFEWVYWHMLLPGLLSHAPLLPAHMSFVGKDLREAPQIRHAREKTLADVMIKDVVSVTSGTSLADAARLMSDRHVSGLPVIDVDGRLAGVVTEADFLSALNYEDRPVVKHLFDSVIRRHRAGKRMGTIVDDIMTRHPITLKSTDSLQHAIEVMERAGLRRVLVSDDGEHLAGVVSRSDLPKLFHGVHH